MVNPGLINRDSVHLPLVHTYINISKEFVCSLKKSSITKRKKKHNSYHTCIIYSSLNSIKWQCVCVYASSDDYCCSELLLYNAFSICKKEFNIMNYIIMNFYGLPKAIVLKHGKFRFSYLLCVNLLIFHL